MMAIRNIFYFIKPLPIRTSNLVFILLGLNSFFAQATISQQLVNEYSIVSFRTPAMENTDRTSIHNKKLMQILNRRRTHVSFFLYSQVLAEFFNLGEQETQSWFQKLKTKVIRSYDPKTLLEFNKQCTEAMMSKWNRVSYKGDHSSTKELLVELLDQTQKEQSQCLEIVQSLIGKPSAAHPHGQFLIKLIQAEREFEIKKQKKAHLEALNILLSHPQTQLQRAAQAIAFFYMEDSIPEINEQARNLIKNFDKYVKTRKLLSVVSPDYLVVPITGSLSLLKSYSFVAATFPRLFNATIPAQAMLATVTLHLGVGSAVVQNLDERNPRSKKSTEPTDYRTRGESHILGELEPSHQFLIKHLRYDVFDRRLLEEVTSNALNRYLKAPKENDPQDKFNWVPKTLANKILSSITKSDENFDLLPFFIQNELSFQATKDSVDSVNVNQDDTIIDVGRIIKIQKLLLSLQDRSRSILSNPQMKMFDKINQVRELIFKNTGMEFYAREQSFKAPLFDKDGGNCVVQTHLFISILWNLRELIGPDWSLGYEMIPQHTQPVIYNTKDKIVFDLVSGSKNHLGKYALYHPASYLEGMLRKTLRRKNPESLISWERFLVIHPKKLSTSEFVFRMKSRSQNPQQKYIEFPPELSPLGSEPEREIPLFARMTYQPLDPSKEISDRNGADFIQDSGNHLGLDLNATRTFLSPKDQVSVPYIFNLMGPKFNTTHPNQPLIGYSLSLRLDVDRDELEAMTTDEERAQYLQNLMDLEAIKYNRINQNFIDDFKTPQLQKFLKQKIDFKKLIIESLLLPNLSKAKQDAPESSKNSKLPVNKNINLNSNASQSSQEVVETLSDSDVLEDSYQVLTGFRMLLKHQLDIEILSGKFKGENLDASPDLLLEVLSDVILKSDEDQYHYIESLILRQKSLNDIYNQEILLLKMLEQNPEHIYKLFANLDTEMNEYWSLRRVLMTILETSNLEKLKTIESKGVKIGIGYSVFDLFRQGFQQKLNSGSLMAQYIHQLSKTREALMRTFSNSRIIGITEKIEMEPSEPKIESLEIKSPKMATMSITDIEKLKSRQLRSTCKIGDEDPKCREQQVVYINLRPAKIYLEPKSFFNLFNLFLNHDHLDIVKKRWLELEPQAFQIFKEEARTAIQNAIASGRMETYDSKKTESSDPNQKSSGYHEKINYIIEGLAEDYPTKLMNLYITSPWGIHRGKVGQTGAEAYSFTPTSKILFEVHKCHKKFTEELTEVEDRINDISKTELASSRISISQDYLGCLDGIN